MAWEVRSSIEGIADAHGQGVFWVLGSGGIEDVWEPLKSPLMGPSAFRQDHPDTQPDENSPVFEGPQERAL